MLNVARDLFKAAKLIALGLTVYAGSIYVLWYYIVLPVVVKYASEHTVKWAASAQFDEVFSAIVLGHAVFCLTRIGAKK